MTRLTFDFSLDTRRGGALEYRLVSQIPQSGEVICSRLLDTPLTRRPSVHSALPSSVEFQLSSRARMQDVELRAFFFLNTTTMSIKWMTFIWDERTDLNGSRLLLALAVADHANDEGRAFPDVDSLARKIRLSRRQTFAVISELDGDVFSIERKPGAKQTKNKSVFHMLKKPVRQTAQVPDDESEGPVQSAAQVENDDLCGLESPPVRSGAEPVRSGVSAYKEYNHQNHQEPPSGDTPEAKKNGAKNGKTNGRREISETEKAFGALLREFQKQFAAPVTKVDAIADNNAIKKLFELSRGNAQLCVEVHKYYQPKLAIVNWATVVRYWTQYAARNGATVTSNGASASLDAQIKRAWQDLAGYQRMSWTFESFATEFKRLGQSPETPDVDF